LIELIIIITVRTIFFLIIAMKKQNILYSVQSIRETEKFLVFTTNLLPGFMMLDKKTLELHGTRRLEDESLGLTLLNYFPHDGDDNTIMFFLDPETWINRKRNNMNNLPKNLKAQIEMVDLNIKKDDNPILIFYKEKD